MGTMMLACGLFMLLVVVVLTLAIMALVKRKRRFHPIDLTYS